MAHSFISNFELFFLFSSLSYLFFFIKKLFLRGGTMIFIFANLENLEGRIDICPNKFPVYFNIYQKI